MNNNFSYSFTSSKSSQEIYSLLLDVHKWWSGLHSEIIKGKSEKLDDEFSFSAGNGVHYSNQKLVELFPNKKIGWLVTESNLTYLSDKNEWTNTKICFDISQEGEKTKVTFTHEGLIPKFECYNGCSGAWTQYLENLERKLN